MKIYSFIALLILSAYVFAQGARPPSLCSDLEPPKNGICYDYPPAVPIIEAIREVLDDDVFVRVISLVEVEIFTGDVGLSREEIRQKIGDARLPDGSQLWDIIFIVEGDIPDLGPEADPL